MPYNIIKPGDRIVRVGYSVTYAPIGYETIALPGIKDADYPCSYIDTRGEKTQLCPDYWQRVVTPIFKPFNYVHS